MPGRAVLLRGPLRAEPHEVISDFGRDTHRIGVSRL